MDIFKEESIILKIGNLKISDTYDTFGENRIVNGYKFIPLEDPKGSWFSQITLKLAHGDSREGVSVSDNKDEILLTFGSNRRGSNAQSMAIGYLAEDEYFFVDECYRDIYDENPIVTSRSIVRCKSLWNNSSDDYIKNVFNIYNSKLKVDFDENEVKLLQELEAKIERLKKAFTKENFSNLRRKEILLKRRENRIKNGTRDDGER